MIGLDYRDLITLILWCIPFYLVIYNNSWFMGRITILLFLFCDFTTSFMILRVWRYFRGSEQMQKSNGSET